MFNFLHNYSPNSILVNFSFIKVHWYGLLIVLAILICLKLVLLKADKQGINKIHLLNLFFYLIIFSLIGARLWHILFYNFNYFINNPWEIFKVWHGGMAIAGAITSGAIVVYLYCKKHKLAFWQISDLILLTLPLGQAIGRWGNYFNQELFGPPCNYSFCIYINPLNRPLEYLGSSYFQPLFLYESLLLIVLFLILYFDSKKKWPTGATTIKYFIGYSVIRFFMEYLRLDITGKFLLLNWMQWLSLVIFIISLFYLFKLYKKTFNNS